MDHEYPSTSAALSSCSDAAQYTACERTHVVQLQIDVPSATYFRICCFFLRVLSTYSQRRLLSPVFAPELFLPTPFAGLLPGIPLSRIHCN